MRRVQAPGQVEIGGQRVVVLEHMYEQLYKIPFQLRSETETKTVASEMTSPNGGQTEVKKWYPSRP